MNDTTLVDAMVGALSDPFDDCHMGVTAENVAKKWNISRADQDALAAESHRRAGSAIDKGYFKAQIVPVEIKVKREVVPFETDETVRRDSTVEKLARLRPVFDPDGTVTAGNASSINDAAAAVVLMERGVAERRGLRPIGRLVGYSYAGVDPKYMGIGPVPAVRSLLEKTGFGLNDIADLPKVEDMSELLGFDLPAGVGEPAPHNALPFGDDGGAAYYRAMSEAIAEGHRILKNRRYFALYVSDSWRKKKGAPSGSGAGAFMPIGLDRKSTRLNSSHMSESRMPSSA